MQGDGLTRISNDTLLAINTHMAHGWVMANHCILADTATLSGDVPIDDYVIVGGVCKGHPFCTFNAHVMVDLSMTFSMERRET